MLVTVKAEGGRMREFFHIKINLVNVEDDL